MKSSRYFPVLCLLVSALAVSCSIHMPFPVPTPSVTPTPSVSPTVAPSATATATATPSSTPTTTPSSSPTVTPSVSPTEIPSVSPTTVPSVSPTSTVTPIVPPIHSPIATPTSTATVTITATPTVVPTPMPSPISGKEFIYYLGSLGQTTGFKTTTKAYGSIGIAGRIGWRYIQPKDSAHFDWTTIDAVQSAAQKANVHWSLSIKAGADVPLWLYNNTCNAAPQIGETGPGTGTLQAFPFLWNQNYEYRNNSVQCVAIPWDPAFQAAWGSFVKAVAARYSADPLLDHVVVAGMNYITQENSQPHSPADLTAWTNILSSQKHTTADYQSLVQNAYTNMTNLWASDFPHQGLATMFIDGPGFPFVRNTSLELSLLNQVVNFDHTRSIVMSNAAQVNSGTVSLDNNILAFSGKSAFAFQELNAQGCANVIPLINSVKSKHGSFLEIYSSDVNCL